MPRMRMVKPEFFTSEQIVECSTNARLLFVGLWCFSDDGGVHPASAARLKMEVFPADPFTVEQVDGWIRELESHGLVETYVVAGQRFWRVTGWHHQKIETPTYRYPRSREFGEQSTRLRRGIVEASTPEGNGAKGSEREATGEEGSFKSDRLAIGLPLSGESDGRKGQSPQSSQSPRSPKKFVKPEDALDLSETDWGRVVSLAEAVARKIPPRSLADRRAWFKYALLALKVFCESWLIDAAEAVVNGSESRKGRQAHFVGVLGKKAEEEGFDAPTFRGFLRRIEIPADVWKSKALELTT